MKNEPALAMERWELLVGRFMLSFGDIELISINLWSELFDAEPPREFLSRAGKIIGKLKEKSILNQNKIQLLQKACDLSNKRNTIGHNPMQIQVYEHTETGEYLLQEGMPAMLGDDYIDDLELMELASEAKALASELYIAIGFDFAKPAI